MKNGRVEPLQAPAVEPRTEAPLRLLEGGPLEGSSMQKRRRRSFGGGN